MNYQLSRKYGQAPHQNNAPLTLSGGEPVALCGPFTSSTWQAGAHSRQLAQCLDALFANNLETHVQEIPATTCVHVASPVTERAQVKIEVTAVVPD